MKAYIASSSIFALRADGEFLGTFKGEAGIDSPPCFVEALFPSPYFNVSFSLDYNIKSTPNIIAYRLDDGILLRLRPQVMSGRGFSLCYQRRHTECGALVTVYRDGGTRITVETPRLMETVDVPTGVDSFSSVYGNGLIAVYSTPSPCYLAVFSLAQGLKLVFADIVEEFEITPAFRTKTRHFDLERTLLTRTFNTDTFCADSIEAERQNEYTPNKGEVFLKRAFFERMALGLDVKDLLSPSLKPHADMLKDYLGDFVEVLPDFCTRKGVCLAYNGKDIRPTKNFELTVSDGLIENITEL